MEPERARTYLAIDLKSFYASVECVHRGLDPLGVHLVVADPTRTEKTICLAVSPSLKAHGIPGRPRLFEVVEKVREINALRRAHAPGRKLTGSSYVDAELKQDPSLELSYIVAPPRMAAYMDMSSQIYRIYLKYVAPEDIHVYSVDEVFIDLTRYLITKNITAREMAQEMIRDVLSQTGITATAGIGTNLYLAKIAMDIVAKKLPADENGVRIAELDEYTYREKLWCHQPITDFWRIGGGYAKKLSAYGMYTMGDVARCSLGAPGDVHNEALLYRLFGVNAELLIDHAWGREPCTIGDIKAYVPEKHSLSTGQVLKEPYPFPTARLAVREMADLLALDLVSKGLVAGGVVLTVGYDIVNLSSPDRKGAYLGTVREDHYGRRVPEHAHGSLRFPHPTSSARQIVQAVTEIFERVVDPNLTVRRMYVVADSVTPRSAANAAQEYVQLDLFSPPEQREREDRAMERENRLMKAVLSIKNRYGKNAILRGMNFEKGATTRERNGQVGGHKA